MKWLNNIILGISALMVLTFYGYGYSQTIQSLGDEEITQAINTELAVDNRISGHLIDITTENGIVTLSGMTDNVLSRHQAENVAYSVKGVQSVINKIEIKTRNRSDSAIKKDIQEALVNNPATDKYNIEVSVEGGVVFLAGMVDSHQEIMLTRKTAMGVKGVTEVLDEFEINYDAKRSDVEIASEINQALRWNVRIDDGLIEVEVDEQVVTLKGTVGSAAEKRRAEVMAWVNGVESVNSRQLAIDYDADKEALRNNKFVTKTDQAIKEALLATFSRDARIKSDLSYIKVNDGRVTLRGDVKSLMAKKAAEENALNVVGVWKVKNLLSVRPDDTSVDQVIEDKIVSQLEKDPYLDRFEVEVEVFNKKATLRGEVDNYYEKERAGDVASDIIGIVQVDNNLKIGNKMEAQYKGIDPPPVSLEQSPVLSDWEIQENIRDQFFWSALVPEEDVTLQVNDGHVIISGQVDTFAERRALTENAYEGGARSVDNEVTVLYPNIEES